MGRVSVPSETASCKTGYKYTLKKIFTFGKPKESQPWIYRVEVRENSFL